MIAHIQKCSKFTKNFFFGKNTTLPEKPWNAIDVVKMVILTGMLLFLASYGALEFSKWYFGEMKTGEFIFFHMKELIIGALLFQVSVEMILLYCYTHWKYGVTLVDFGLKDTPVRATLALAAFLFLLIAFGQNYFIEFLQYIPGVLGLEFSFFGVVGDSGDSISLSQLVEDKIIPYWFLFVFAGILAPITEELIFRGFVLPSIMKNMGYVWGVVISSAIFALSHMVFEPVTLLIMFLLGCLLSVLYIRTKSLWLGIIFHAINNTAGIFLAVSGIEKLAQ